MMQAQAQAAAVASLPLETQLKLRRASWVNFAASMLQVTGGRRDALIAARCAPLNPRTMRRSAPLTCALATAAPGTAPVSPHPTPPHWPLQLAASVAVIIMVRYNLEGASLSIFSIGGHPAASASYQCLMATTDWPVRPGWLASSSILIHLNLKEQWRAPLPYAPHSDDGAIMCPHLPYRAQGQCAVAAADQQSTRVAPLNPSLDTPPPAPTGDAGRVPVRLLCRLHLHPAQLLAVPDAGGAAAAVAAPTRAPSAVGMCVPAARAACVRVL